MSAPPHVVIIGGGFAGLYLAKRLRRAPVRVTLIDRRNHHLFQPMLYQVASAALNPSDIASPIRSILRKHKHLEVLLGEAVRIDTVTHQGLNTRDDPITYFGAAGIRAEDVLEDAKRVFRAMKREEGAGPHILTGPIYVEGAEPGDMLEARVLDVAIRVPYGVNSTGPGWGAAPDLLDKPAAKVIRLDLERRVALFAENVEVPLAPFMGIVAVAPPPELKQVSTKPPGAFGGNIDFRHLTAGSTLYLPVFNEGALFYTGDGHAVHPRYHLDRGAPRLLPAEHHQQRLARQRHVRLAQGELDPPPAGRPQADLGHGAVGQCPGWRRFLRGDPVAAGRKPRHRIAHNAAQHPQREHEQRGNCNARHCQQRTTRLAQ